MEKTTRLGLPYIIAQQAQKHVTHNEALRMLDTIVQMSVGEKDLTEPPPAPVNGDAYIVGPSASGKWKAHGNEEASRVDGAWMYFEPREGWRASVQNEDRAVV